MFRRKNEHVLPFAWQQAMCPVQLGLRFENTVSHGHQLGNVQKPDSTFRRNYNSVFPTAYIQYKLDSTGRHTLNLKYGRRIDRPYYEDLNPFLSPLDKFTYYMGNPFLKPSCTDSFEVSHTWKNITTTLNYSRTKDDVNETIEIVDGIYYSRPGNLGRIIAKGASLDASFDLAKWFNFHFYGSVTNYHTTSQFYTGTLNTHGTYFFVRPILQFKLPEGWTTQVDGGYQSKITSAQFVIAPRGKINMEFTKKLSPSLSMSLVGNDLFHTFTNGGDINNLANVKANYLNRGDSRTVVLSVNYRFGKTIADLRRKGLLHPRKHSCLIFGKFFKVIYQIDYQILFTGYSRKISFFLNVNILFPSLTLPLLL